MQANTRILTLAVAASMVVMATPATAVAPVGNYSLTFDSLVFADTDWKEGVGVFEPGGPSNPCPGQLLLGLRAIQPLSHYYQTGRVATNVKESGVHADGITPIPLAACPLPVAPPQDSIEIWFNGLNVRVLYDAMAANLNLCSQLIQSTDGGCIPDPSSVILRVADCPWDDASFGHLTADGKPDFGAWDILGGALGGSIWGDSIACAAFGHSHDYSPTVTDFSTNFAATGFDLIQNDDIVHEGSGDRYAIICWGMDYLNLDSIDANGDGDTTDIGDTPANTVATANAHDWQLILDAKSAPASHADPLRTHFNPLGPAFLQGLYSTAPDDGDGNGFGNCPTPGTDHDKKKDLIVLPAAINLAGIPLGSIEAPEPIVCENNGTLLCGGGSCYGPETNIVAVLFQHSDYGGRCLKLLGSACPAGASETSGYQYVIDLKGTGFNDRTSSAEVTDLGVSLGCGTVKLFEHAGFNGASTPCSTDCTSLGAMDDETSSLKVW